MLCSTNTAADIFGRQNCDLLQYQAEPGLLHKTSKNMNIQAHFHLMLLIADTQWKLLLIKMQMFGKQCCIYQEDIKLIFLPFTYFFLYNFNL